MIVNFDSLINLKKNLAKGIAVSAIKASAVFLMCFMTSCGEADDEEHENKNPDIELLKSYEEGDYFDLECDDFEILLCSKEIIDKDGIFQTSFYFNDTPIQGRFVSFAMSFLIEESIIIKKSN